MPKAELKADHNAPWHVGAGDNIPWKSHHGWCWRASHGIIWKIESAHITTEFNVHYSFHSHLMSFKEKHLTNFWEQTLSSLHHLHVKCSSSWCLLHLASLKFHICNHSEKLSHTPFVTNSCSLSFKLMSSQLQNNINVKRCWSQFVCNDCVNHLQTALN